MTFLIITHVPHSIEQMKYFAYAPYVREMNIWLKQVDKVLIAAPVSATKKTAIDIDYQHHNIDFIPIASFDVLSYKSVLNTILKTPSLCWTIFKAMRQADHIHLRCPGNIGLLGCFVQILFPNKPKTAKYAGNWDPKAIQPWSYRLQKWLLSNTFLAKNMKVLVYGEWPNQTKNIVPFFTATYSENEINDNYGHPEFVEANFIFVGALTKGKQPLLSVAVIQKLKEKGHQVKLDIYGEGSERLALEQFIAANNLSAEVVLHGNCDKETVKRAYQTSHFLLFVSQSEGWPKAVAEAMFWGCVPITGKVSCIPFMLNNGERGALVNANADEIVAVAEDYLNQPKKYSLQSAKAMQWSRQFTMEKFEEEIGKLMGQ